MQHEGGSPQRIHILSILFLKFSQEGNPIFETPFSFKILSIRHVSSMALVTSKSAYSSRSTTVMAWVAIMDSEAYIKKKQCLSPF